MIDYIDFLKRIYYPAMAGICVLLFAYFGLLYIPEPLPLPMFFAEVFFVLLLPFGYVNQISNLYIKNGIIRYFFLILTSILFFIGFSNGLNFIYNNQLDWYVPILIEIIALVISISVVPITLIILSLPFKLLDMYISGTKELYYKYGIHDAIQDNELVDVENDVNHIKGGDPFFWQSSKTMVKKKNVSYKKMDLHVLKKLLEQRVVNEEYEEAAKIRDVIYKKEKR